MTRIERGSTSTLVAKLMMATAAYVITIAMLIYPAVAAAGYLR